MLILVNSPINIPTLIGNEWIYLWNYWVMKATSLSNNDIAAVGILGTQPTEKKRDCGRLLPAPPRFVKIPSIFF